MKMIVSIKGQLFSFDVNEAQEPDDDVLSAREEFIAPGRIPFHHFQADSAILRYEPCPVLVGLVVVLFVVWFGGACLVASFSVVGRFISLSFTSLR